LSDVAKAWKQYTAPDGRPYFYNKITKESKWVMPEEMKQAAAAAAGGQTAGAHVQKGAAEFCSTHMSIVARVLLCRGSVDVVAAAQRLPSQHMRFAWSPDRWECQRR
jgi:hypothetical protein